MKKVYKTYIASLKDGLNVFIIQLILLTIFIIICFAVPALSGIAGILAGMTIIILLLTINFFRDPERKIKYKNNMIYAAADGQISSIDIVQEKEYLKTKCYRIKVFMNVFNVHRNRIPMAGTIDLVKYKKGQLRSAFKEVEDSNEQFIVSVKTRSGKIVFKQIAGLIARRIVCDLKKGDKVQTGYTFGMIKFGSAVITYIPVKKAKILIEKGQNVKAGITEMIQIGK